jgi:uncharacterized protein (TIGR02118 family)
VSRIVTVKLVVLYTQPSDPDAFDRHYLGTHMPLVNAIPGLQRAEAGRFASALDGGEQTYYRIAELYFADQAAMQAGFASPEGGATAADYQQIAPPGSRMFVAAVDD